MAEWWARYVPNHKLLTAKEMKKTIGLVVGKLMDEAHESQYDVGVCVRSVQATNAAFKAVPLKGSAGEYGLAVESALSTIEESYWDDAGEHTSKGMIGSLGSDIALILRTQQSDEIINIDRDEARQCLKQEMHELAQLIPVWFGETNDTKTERKSRDKLREIVLESKSQKLFQIKGMVFSQNNDTESVVKTEVTGESGFTYFVKMRYKQISEDTFAIKGAIHSSNVDQFPVLELRTTHQSSSAAK